MHGDLREVSIDLRELRLFGPSAQSSFRRHLDMLTLSVDGALITNSQELIWLVGQIDNT